MYLRIHRIVVDFFYQLFASQLWRKEWGVTFLYVLEYVDHAYTIISNSYIGQNFVPASPPKLLDGFSTIWNMML